MFASMNSIERIRSKRLRLSSIVKNCQNPQWTECYAEFEFTKLERTAFAQRLRGPIGGERVETNSNSYTQVVLVSRRWQFGIV